MPNRTAILVIGGALTMLAAAFSLQSTVALAQEGTQQAIEEIWAIQSDAWEETDDVVAQASADMNLARPAAEVVSIRDDATAEILTIDIWAQGEMWQVAADADWIPEVTEAWEAASSALAAHAAASVALAYDRASIRLDEIRLDVLAKIPIRLDNGLARLGTILADYAAALDAATTAAEAAAARDDAVLAIEDRHTRTAARLDNQRDRYPDHPDVQTAHAGAMETWTAATGDAVETVYALHESWVAPPPTTTSTLLPTTTSVPTTTTTRPAVTTSTTPTTSTTTTTVPSTTTTSTTTTTVPSSTTTTSTTVEAAVPVPPQQPPRADAEFLPNLPEPVTLSAGAVGADDAAAGVEIATVGFVHRVVDSQLPAGVSAVAAGPLVVLGLIIDAVRAAGTLMLAPWLLLAIYIAGLLRGWRGFTSPAGGRD